MQKNYTVKEKNPIQTPQPQKSTLDSILNFSKGLEVVKGDKLTIEYLLN